MHGIELEEEMEYIQYGENHDYIIFKHHAMRIFD